LKPQYGQLFPKGGVLELKVRDLEERDRESFATLLQNFFLYSSGEREDSSRLEEIFHKAVSPTTNFFFLVAECGTDLVGMLSLTFGESSYKAAPFAWMDDLFVEEAKRGEGVGEAPLTEAQKRAKDRGCSNVMVGVGGDEQDALNFYQKRDFFDMECKLLSLPL
jgi:GNAT superfamily N-acetyltransferase